MITLFTTAKPFIGHSGVIQRNALKSWRLLHSDVEIMIFGNDEGTEEVCSELGLQYEPDVQRTEFGAIRLDHVFEKAQQLARHNMVCYANCDIVLMSDFSCVLERFHRCRKPFLIIGKRWDTNIAEELDFHPSWEERLRTRAVVQNRRRPVEVDYFVFPRGTYRNLLPFGIGRRYWDHWLVWKARSSKASVIDASYAITAIHQNHDYNHHAGGREGVWEGVEAKRNFTLAGGLKHLYAFEGCTHLLTPRGSLLTTPLRRPLTQLASLASKQSLLNNTFWFRRRVGLRRQSLQKAIQGLKRRF